MMTISDNHINKLSSARKLEERQTIQKHTKELIESIEMEEKLKQQTDRLHSESIDTLIAKVESQRQKMIDEEHSMRKLLSEQPDLSQEERNETLKMLDIIGLKLDRNADLLNELHYEKAHYGHRASHQEISESIQQKYKTLKQYQKKERQLMTWKERMTYRYVQWKQRIRRWRYGN